jgi:LAO/AO transport system kinase
MVDFFVIKIAGAGDELQGIKRVLWKWQIQLSSIKQMAITFERHNSRNQSSTEPHLFPAKKVRLDSYNCNLGAITQDGFQKFGKPSRNLSNSRKAMIILMKNAWNRTLDAEAINEQLKGFYNNTEIQNLLESTKSGAKR